MLKKHYKGYYYEWKHSKFLKHNGKEINIYACLSVVIDALLTFAAGIAVLFSFQYCLYSGINQGVITALFSLSSLYLAIFAYYFFKQKITAFHIIGMICLVACAILLVMSKNYAVLEIDPANQTSPAIAVVLAIVSTIILCIRTILVKYF